MPPSPPRSGISGSVYNRAHLCVANNSVAVANLVQLDRAQLGVQECQHYAATEHIRNHAIWARNVRRNALCHTLPYSEPVLRTVLHSLKDDPHGQRNTIF